MRNLKFGKMNMKKKSDVGIDFSNTEIAFSNKSNKDLKRAAWLFNTMNKAWLVSIGSSLAMFALRLRLPFVEKIIKNTMFRQFVGGTTLLECQPNINKLYDFNTLSILDYGAEAKKTEQDFNRTMNETIRAIEFAATNASVPIVSSKITGLARFELLESIQNGETLTKETKREYRNILKRIDSICHVAHEKNVGVFFDAEESWIQYSIDHLVTLMMKRYNKNKIIVYNTFQMYRVDRLQFLFNSFDLAKKDGYKLGAKLVRGAYMEKERERAQEKNYPSPIHPSKEATDDAYNTALRFCVDNYEEIASCNATHNQKSCELQAQLIHEKRIDKNHPHLNFCQLYGMSDHLTFNLAHSGFNVAKYMVYGQIREVVPYLIRRANENKAVTGDMSREYKLIYKEVKRRNLS